MTYISRRTASKYISLGASSMLINPLIHNQISGKMNNRVIPSSDEKLPVVGLGTWQTFDVGGSKEEKDSLKEVLKILIEHGGSVIDSSPMYGKSEGVVGELTNELKSKKTFFEATKVWTTGKDRGIEQMKDSMKLMKVNQMDLMQIHNLLDWKTHINTLKKWKEEGKVRYIGITHYHKGAYSEVEQIIKNVQIDFVQINYNLAVREAAEVILPLAKEKGIAVLINRPYQGGSLFQKVRNLQLPEWAAEFEARSWGQFFLKFILAHSAVNCVIPGTAKAKHMLDNMQAGFGPLPNKQHLKKMINFITTI